MYFAYVDETGTDGASPAVVMVGIVANAARLKRTQDELSDILGVLSEMASGNLTELKGKHLFPGKGVWNKVPGDKRRNIACNICGWLKDRKHHLALAAIDCDRMKADPPGRAEVSNIWQATACHIALQLQRAHQKQSGGKGRTVLVFDDNKQEAANFGDLVYSPPAWTDDFYGRGKKQASLDMIIDTPFAVKSHQVGLIQVADVLAHIFRRHAELSDYGQQEDYVGEAAHVSEWVDDLSPMLLQRAHRWPKRSKSPCARWYTVVAPPSLVALG